VARQGWPGVWVARPRPRLPRCVGKGRPPRRLSRRGQWKESEGGTRVGGVSVEEEGPFGGVGWALSVDGLETVRALGVGWGVGDWDVPGSPRG
jgi:hypothetical protein